ncbi:MAG: hypothetical protein IMF19_00890 [Proteobacteria bacterium]|nr:hypothetical protein [Pseudomonadota bacterium]
MTPEEEEIRKRLGVKSEDVYYIPTAPLWELCRQFDEALPGKYEFGKMLYRFYCKRIKEIAKQAAETKR